MFKAKDKLTWFKIKVLTWSPRVNTLILNQAKFLSLCLFVCLLVYLKNHIFKFHNILCTMCTC